MSKFLIELRDFLMSFNFGKFLINLYRYTNVRFKKAKISSYPFVYFGDEIYLDDNYETHLKSYIIKHHTQ